MRSMSLFFWLLCVAVFALGLHGVRAQETAEDLLPHQAMDAVLHEPIRYAFSGTITASRYTTRGFVSVLDWICEEKLAATLELTEQQQLDLKNICVDLHMVLKNDEGADNTGFIPRESERFDQAYQDFLPKMQEILTKKQVQNLEQLSWRRLLKRNGVVLLLLREDVQQILGFEFEITRELKDVLAEQIKQITEVRNQLKQRANEVFHEGLSDKQVELFDRDWKRYLDAYEVSTINHFLNYDCDKFETNESLKNIHGVDLRYSLDGNCEYKTFEWTEKSKIQNARPIQQRRELERLISNSALLEMLELSDEQAAEITGIVNRFDDEDNAQQKTFAQEYNVPFGLERGRNRNGYLFEIVMLEWRQFEGDEKAAQAEAARRHDLLAKQFVEELTGVLVPSQKEIIEQLKVQTIIRQLGPIADLQHGDLQQWVALSPEEFDAYNQRCKEVAKELRRETRAVFEKSFDAIIDAVPRDVRKEIKSRMSEEQSDGFVDLDTWLMLLKQGQIGSDVRMPENLR